MAFLNIRDTTNRRMNQSIVFGRGLNKQSCTHYLYQLHLCSHATKGKTQTSTRNAFVLECVHSQVFAEPRETKVTKKRKLEEASGGSQIKNVRHMATIRASANAAHKQFKAAAQHAFTCTHTHKNNEK